MIGMKHKKRLAGMQICTVNKQFRVLKREKCALFVLA